MYDDVPNFRDMSADETPYLRCVSGRHELYLGRVDKDAAWFGIMESQIQHAMAQTAVWDRGLGLTRRCDGYHHMRQTVGNASLNLSEAQYSQSAFCSHFCVSNLSLGRLIADLTRLRTYLHRPTAQGTWHILSISVNRTFTTATACRTGNHSFASALCAIIAWC